MMPAIIKRGRQDEKNCAFWRGQAGAAVSRLLGADWEAVCFADNDREKWGAFLEDLPVLSPAESLLREPDCFCLCALNAGRREQMARQLREQGIFPMPVCDLHGSLVRRRG